MFKHYILVLTLGLCLLIAPLAQAQDQDHSSVVGGDYQFTLPDTYLDWQQLDSPALDDLLVGQYLDQDQTILYQATATSRSGRTLTIAILQREHASQRFGDIPQDQFQFIGYVHLQEPYNDQPTTLLWVDYIDPIRDRHLVFIVEGHPRLFNALEDELFQSSLSLQYSTG